MTRVAVAGARGRMGQRIAELIRDDADAQLSGLWEHPGHPEIGTAPYTNGPNVADNIVDGIAEADVYIDFTRPEVSLDHLEAIADKQVAAVIGTTGFSDTQMAKITQYASTIPIVWAPNMSVGVNLLIQLLEQALTVLDLDYDAEIIELHHHWKEDAPSGTAKALLEKIVDARQVPDERIAHGRNGIVGARKPNEVGVHAVRAGEIFGDHTVLLAGPGERIELTHRALSRDPFANGAVRAAKWVATRPPGLYAMQDVLGF